ncbi:hypothetical protein ACU6DD_000586 [Campylobacter jejuni]
MIDVIKDVYGLNSTFAGVLTSLPLIAFGSISFIVGYFSPIRAINRGDFFDLYWRNFAFLYRDVWFIFGYVRHRLWYSNR